MKHSSNRSRFNKKLFKLEVAYWGNLF